MLKQIRWFVAQPGMMNKYLQQKRRWLRTTRQKMSRHNSSFR